MTSRTALSRFAMPLLSAALLALGCGDSAHSLGNAHDGGAGSGGGTTGTAGAGGRGGGTGTAGAGGSTTGAGGTATGAGGTATGAGGSSGVGGRGGAGGGAGRGGSGGVTGSAGRGGAGGAVGAGGSAGRGGAGGTVGSGGRGGAGGGSVGGAGGRGGASGAGGAGGAGGAQTCSSSPSIVCPSGQDCDYDTPNRCGAGFEPGHCITLPTGCLTNVDPVCGCDGKTYSNDCERQRARAQLDHTGACAGAGGAGGGGGGGGGAGGGPSCADCNDATQYCHTTVGGVLFTPRFDSCLALPAACGATPTCACLATVDCGSVCATAADGAGLTITCQVP